VAGDLTVRNDVAGLVAAAAELGGLDILVNNAASVTYVPIAEMTDDQVDEATAVNFRGALWTMQEACRRMRDGGRIVNVSTLGTSHPVHGQALYSATKAALEQLTLVGALELAGRGITVNTVCPGATETETFRESAPPGLAEVVAKASHFQRIGRPADIADVVAFLVSDDARWVTGQRLVVSGGAQ
jgi:3-oxoacyl-[acyl-carrier protein] reductase